MNNNSWVHNLNISRLFREELACFFNSKVLWAINEPQCQRYMQNSEITRVWNILALLWSGLQFFPFVLLLWQRNVMRSADISVTTGYCISFHIRSQKNVYLMWNPNRAGITKHYLMNRVNIHRFSNQFHNGTSVKMDTLTHNANT